MEEKEIDFYLMEFQRSRDTWTQIALSTLFHGDEIEESYSIKKLDFFVSLTVLSVAFLTIVVPLIRAYFSKPIILSIIFFLMTFLSGIVLSILTIKRKIKLTREDTARKHKIFNNYIGKCNEIISRLLDCKQDPNNKEIFKNIEKEIVEYESSRNNVRADDQKWLAAKSKEFGNIILKYLETIFWVSFSFALFLFIVWLIQIIIIPILCKNL